MNFTMIANVGQTETVTKVDHTSIAFYQKIHGVDVHVLTVYCRDNGDGLLTTEVVAGKETRQTMKLKERTYYVNEK